MKKNIRNVIIVGASSSIGDAIVKNFYKKGDNIVATFNKNKPDSVYSSVNYEKLDLGSRSSIKTFAKSKIKELGKIDIVIFLPSILPGKSLNEYEQYDCVEHEGLYWKNTSQDSDLASNYLPNEWDDLNGQNLNPWIAIYPWNDGTNVY